MKVLVTGATGFLGSWLVRRLLDEGHDVRIIKRPKSPAEDLERLKLDIRHGDVIDAGSLHEAFRGVDSVFHLAGLVAYTRKERDAMVNVNIHGTRNVVQACEAAGVRRLVHMSSVVAVGASFDGKTPLNEGSPYTIGHLDLGYFETKREAEEIVKQASDAGRIDAVILNPSTIYGPADAKKGSRSVQVKVAKGRFPFFPPGGVSVVSVEDVVDATVAAWEKGSRGERYIVSGENLLIKEVFDIIAQEAGVKAPAIGLPRAAIFALGRVGDFMEALGRKGPLNSENAWTSVLYHWFDSSKAQKQFGLNLKPASYAIGQSIKWMKDNGILIS